MRLEYPAKVLLAWGEAISGHVGLRDWLTRNGYPELGIFTYALHHKQDARQWLMKNDHAHLMAVIRGVEGDKEALEWLDRSGLHVLHQLALTGDGDEDAFQWLVAHGHRELALIGKRIHKVKTDIDEENSDPHKYPGR